MYCKCINNLIKKKIVFYEKKCRFVFIKLFKNKGSQFLDFCFICGKKLVKNLINEFYEELQKIYKDKPEIDIYLLVNEELPEEFRTGEWWIKRGL